MTDQDNTAQFVYSENRQQIATYSLHNRNSAFFLKDLL